MIVLDTSVLVAALTGDQRLAGVLRRTIEDGERLGLTALVLYEWLRGPRTEDEIATQRALVPVMAVLPFGAEEAAIAARLFHEVPRSKTRQFDLGIAASVIHHDAALWTLNLQDFRDIPGLRLHTPPGAPVEDRR